MNCLMTGVAVVLTMKSLGKAANKTVWVNLPTSDEANASNVFTIAMMSSFVSLLSCEKRRYLGEARK